MFDKIDGKDVRKTLPHWQQMLIPFEMLLEAFYMEIVKKLLDILFNKLVYCNPKRNKRKSPKKEPLKPKHLPAYDKLVWFSRRLGVQSASNERMADLRVVGKYLPFTILNNYAQIYKEYFNRKHQAISWFSVYGIEMDGKNFIENFGKK